ncbi:MAG: bifunctional [glutamine synthetase] adenylyltransferase/[glutamine synthetase]-adenylyl-L-tyrosine phosphorylase, partial [Micrococcus sp.]|nr:bifunctional [glutamine synthetase] adenylyltransferase/[glutamine synthetase]-adenylyl-L-tyrosine phosphorylase [Micrococcus sp.]
TDTEEPPSDTEAAVIAAELASGMAKGIYGSAAEPALWEVDANLRPEGKDGALSRTVDSHREYYRRWAHGWEFQALLKARPIAGDAELGQRYIEAMWPLVWESSAREGFVEQVQQMRARVMDTLSHTERDREIKLGAGGLRDVEFTAQLLQLVHGRADESVRVRSTLEAITALQQATYISTADATAFAGHYRWLRALEHRIQLVHLRRTHLMPAKEAAQRVIARSLRGAGDTATATGEDLTAAFRRVRREVRHLHERIFYRPLLSTTAALSAGEVKLTAEAVQARLSALGYRDPRGALRHIESLTQGVSRRAAMQRQLLPVMLGWFANGTDPDRGLLAFRRLSESLGQSSWFLRMLRDSDAAAQRLCRVLSTSRFIGDQLEHSPESAAWFGDDKQLAPVDTAALWSQLSARLSRRTQAESAAQVIRHVRQVRRREVLRIAVADALGRLDIQQIGQALADIDTVAVVGALQTCLREIEREEELITDLAVIAMGRQGGREITYGSDADVMYVHRPHAGADPDAAHEQAVRLAKQVAAVLRQPPQPPLPGERPLEMDADLRPEGRQGPLARTLDSYQEYYRRWAEVWERQALLRARVVAGESTLCREVTDWVDSVRYGGGLNSAEVREIRRIKARVEAERLPRGADPNRHVKLGRGGLSDVEWLVQSLQLRHADEISALRTTATLPALRALASHEILPSRDAEALETAWLLATRIRAASFLWSGKTSDVLPSSARDLQGLARWCAPEATTAADFEAHYLRVTRHARHVFEAHFYGLD